MKRVVPRLDALQYDGTNGDEICQMMTPPAVKISESDGRLLYEVQGFETPVNQGDYVLREGLDSQWGMVLSAEEYTRRYVELPE